jgi:large subunit ribosomal protein L24
VGLGIKKNDTVVVIAGVEKGKRGRVIGVDPRRDRIIVEGIKMIKKHMKPSSTYRQGGIIEKESSVHRSNLMLICPKCDKPTRIGHSILENNKKVRLCKKCREVTD